MSERLTIIEANIKEIQKQCEYHAQWPQTIVQLREELQRINNLLRYDLSQEVNQLRIEVKEINKKISIIYNTMKNALK